MGVICSQNQKQPTGEMWCKKKQIFRRVLSSTTTPRPRKEEENSKPCILLLVVLFNVLQSLGVQVVYVSHRTVVRNANFASS